MENNEQNNEETEVFDELTQENVPTSKKKYDLLKRAKRLTPTHKRMLMHFWNTGDKIGAVEIYYNNAHTSYRNKLNIINSVIRHPLGEAYLQKLDAKLEDQLIIDKTDVIEKILDIVDGEDEKTKNILQALKMINDMYGFNQPQQHDIQTSAIVIERK